MRHTSVPFFPMKYQYFKAIPCMYLTKCWWDVYHIGIVSLVVITEICLPMLSPGIYSFQFVTEAINARPSLGVFFVKSPASFDNHKASMRFLRASRYCFAICKTVGALTCKRLAKPCTFFFRLDSARRAKSFIRIKRTILSLTIS